MGSITINRANHIVIRRFAQAVATIFLGIIIPLTLIFQAYSVLHDMNARFQAHENSAAMTDRFLRVKKELSNVNDYLLYTKLHAERTNYEVLVNKQIMKVAVMNIGFAVVSVGIMFILLGFKESGTAGRQDSDGLAFAGEASGVKFDIKTGSTGLAIFVLGAVMATGGGVIPNEYHGGVIPGYWHLGDNTNLQEKAAVSEFKDCKENSKDGEQFARCFTSRFFEIYTKELEK